MVSKKRVTSIINICTLILLISVASAMGYLFRHIGFPETNIVLVYLLAVLLVSCCSNGYLLGIVASFFATLAFNYFFTDPYFTFSVNDPSYIITFIIMTITALITSTLTSRVKQSALESRQKEIETQALYNLTNHLTDAKDMHDIASIATSTISNCFDCQCACICLNENGTLEDTFIQQAQADKQIHRKVINKEDLQHAITNLRTAYHIGDEFGDFPIYGRENILGIIRIPIQTASQMNETQQKRLRSMIESTALAMDRFQAALHQMKAHEETVQERYRSNLLRAISHDLRTPLSGIMGTSEMLMDMLATEDSCYHLAEDIYKDADWLHALVENILNLTRLQDGRLTLHKEVEAIEEVVGVAVNHIMKRYPRYEFRVEVPDELLMVPMDGKLIEQVLVNLLDNAVKHTPEGEEIATIVKKDNNTVVFSIIDRGIGIDATDLSTIFQPFYTSLSKIPDAKRGIGLGLTICEAIVKAHGGNISAHNLKDKKGAKFTFSLPLEVTTNESINS